MTFGGEEDDAGGAPSIALNFRRKVFEMDPREMTFGQKCSAAFRIFFPPREDGASRTSAKDRLRMILVADRCALSEQNMEQMKDTIVEALEEYVEVDKAEEVDLAVSNDSDMGVVYSVSVPVRRVKPALRASIEELDGTEDWDSLEENPGAHFPWGT